ncbi:MAG TPA: general stress protein [Acidimicrobiales bacterium]|jgi:hypothetical protein|nr:general stress protein [Acidimicrobiales bacterium]
MSASPDKAENHIVAVFDDVETAQKAVDALRGAGIPEGRLSVLTRGDEQPESASPEDLAEASNTAGAGLAKGAVVGGGAGALLGALGGALAIAIPGFGTALGIGMLAGAVSGAVAGGTAGALWAGFERMWDMGYRDLLAGGGVLVAVHTDDPAEAEEARRILHDLGPVRMDQLDRHGEVVRAG